MMTNKTLFRVSILGLVAASFAACNKNDAPAQNTSGIRPRVEYNTLTKNTSYFETFKDATGNTTVNFSGQTTRQDMLAEMNTLMSNAKTTPVDSAKLSAMFANTGSPFAAAELNAATDKTLKSKTAGSFSPPKPLLNARSLKTGLVLLPAPAKRVV